MDAVQSGDEHTVCMCHAHVSCVVYINGVFCVLGVGFSLLFLLLYAMSVVSAIVCFLSIFILCSTSRHTSIGALTLGAYGLLYAIYYEFGRPFGALLEPATAAPTVVQATKEEAEEEEEEVKHNNNKNCVNHNFIMQWHLKYDRCMCDVIHHVFRSRSRPLSAASYTTTEHYGDAIDLQLRCRCSFVSDGV